MVILLAKLMTFTIRTILYGLHPMDGRVFHNFIKYEVLCLMYWRPIISKTIFLNHVNIPYKAIYLFEYFFASVHKSCHFLDITLYIYSFVRSPKNCTQGYVIDGDSTCTQSMFLVKGATPKNVDLQFYILMVWNMVIGVHPQ